MLPKAVEQLVVEIAEHLDESNRRAFGDKSGRNKKKATEDPEACLVSMLTLIKKRLPFVSATLKDAIEGISYDEYLKKAREKLAQAEAEEVKS